MDEEYLLLKKIKVNSIWGAISSFFLLQIFGYVIFETFLQSVNFLQSELSSGFVAILDFIIAIGFLIMFLFFQSEAFFKIGQFFLENDSNTIFNNLKKGDELIKFCLTPVFIIMLILIMFGFYPFQRYESNIYYLIIFYVFSWGVSILISKLRKNKTTIAVYGGVDRIAWILLGLFFFILSIIIPRSSFIKDNADIMIKFIELLGMLGIGIVISLISSLLMDSK